FFRTGVEWMDRVMKEIEPFGRPLRCERALDFGCGAGRLTQALCRHFERCSGVDIAQSMIDLANQYNQYVDRCRYHVNGSTRLKHFETDTFDFVYSIIVLQHMEAPYIEAYLAEFIRVLNPGGLAVVQIPAEVNPGRNGAAGRDSAAALPTAAFRAEVDAGG